MNKLIAIPLLTLVANIAVACPGSLSRERPVIPDGSVVNPEEMYLARMEVQAFLDEGVEYLNCHDLNTRRHNRLVKHLERVAEQFNRELATHRSNSQLLAGD